MLGILALFFLLAAGLLTVAATTGLPLTPVARMALRRVQWAPREASVQSLRLRWLLPGTIQFSLRGIRVEDRNADPVAAVADATVDFSIGRLVGGRMLPSRVMVSGAEWWMRAQPGSGSASAMLPAAGAHHDALPAAAPPAAPFTLAAVPGSCWLRTGEEMRWAIAGLQVHVLPATPQHVSWHSAVFSLDGGLAGRSQGMSARFTVRNAGGAALVEGTVDLRPDSGTVASTLTVPPLDLRDALALVPPGLIPAGATADGKADLRLHAQARLPLPKEVTADWEVHLAPGHLLLASRPEPLEFPDTSLVGRALLKGAELEATARLTGGGNTPWADIQLEAAGNLQSLKGSLRAKSPGTDLARLAALLPGVGVSFPAATALRFEASADVDGSARAVENLRLRLDLDAGPVTIGNRKLDTPGIGVTVSGRAAAGFPEGEATIAVHAGAAFPQASMAVDAEATWDGKTGRLRVQSRSTPFDAGLLLRYLPRLPAGTALALPVSWTVEADLDARAGSIRRAKAALELGAGSLAMPEYLSGPLAIAPCRFAAEIEDEGATGRIAPYDWTVGPLTLHSDGGGWTRTGDRLEGGFALGLGRMRIADGIALLSQKIRAQLPAELAEVGELAVASFAWREHLTGAWKDGQPVFNGSVADGRLDLEMGPEPFSVLLHLDMPVRPLTAHAEVTIPDFVQARWRLPLLDRLPVPWIDAPARAQFTADWEFPDRLKSARWRVEAGAGRILPRGLLARWLGEPIPLTRFAAGGSVGPGLSHFEIGEFLIESGRARCRFDQFAIDIKPEADRRRLHIGGRLVLDHWFAQDFIPLLRGTVRDGLPGQGTALLDLGLETFTASLDAAVAVEPSGKVIIESMSHEGNCVLRVGDQPLPLTTAAGYDPVAHQIFVRTEVAGLRPAQFTPQLARGLAVTPSVFDFPVDLRLEARSAVPADFPQTQLPLPEVAVTVRGGPGTIHRCELLAVDTPLRSFELEADASVGDQTLKSFRATADFGGPVIGIDSLRASLGDTRTAAVTATLTDLPLDWLLARAPPGLLAPDARAVLPRLAVGGVVRSLRIAAEARGLAGQPGKPAIVALRIDGEVEKPAVRLKDWPELTVGSVRIASDAQAIKVAATDLQAGPLRMPALEITASQILSAKPAVAGRLTVLTHLAEWPGFLQSLPAVAVLPRAFDWSKLGGNLTAEGTFGADLSRLPDPAAWSADMNVRVDDLIAPAIPGQFETTPGACDAHLRFGNSVAEIEGTLDARLKRGFDVIEGPVRARFGARAEVAGRAEATLGIDFKDAGLCAPGNLAWVKAPGAEASLQGRVVIADFHCPGRTASATFELAGKGLVYERLGIKGHVDARIASEGTPTAVKLVCDSIEAGETSLHFEADAVWPQSLDARLSGARLDLRPLVRLAAPRLATLNTPAGPRSASAGAVAAKPAAPSVPANPVPAGAVVSAAHPAAAVDAAASPISPAPADRMASFLPTETKIQVTLQEIVLGGGRTIAPFALTARLHGEQPVSGDLSFDSSNHGVRASLLPGAGRASWSLKVDDVADLIAVGTSPLRELPAAMTSADTTIGGLISLPEWFEGGRLTSDGTLDLENAGNVMQGHLQIRDLLLRREIPFLSSIAALVKHSVKKGTPFDEFRVDSFTIGRKSAHLQNAFLDGPISLTAEKADFDFVTSELFLRGKIFGIWFEVKGPRGKPEFYLADKNAALKYLTTEDEFQW